MNKKDLLVNIENISDYIYIIRGYKVMLDEDLAMLYGVLTKRLNEQVLRNIDRFPKDFAFQLTQNEWENLRSQIATSKLNSLKSQFATLKNGRGKHRKYLPYAFTEQGVAMLSSVLRSPQAVAVNIEIMRVFVKLRHILSEHKDLAKKMEELQSFVLKNSHKNDKEFKRVWDVIRKLMTPPENQRKIGFDLNS